MDSPLIQLSKIQWEIPAPLSESIRKEISLTPEKIAHEERVLRNLPCYYSREYQIPKQPKIGLLNLEPNFEALKMDFDLIEKPGLTLNEPVSLSGLFIKKSASLKREQGKVLKRGILKKTGDILKGEYLFTQEDETVLKNLIFILGLNVTDLSEFLIKTSNAIHRDPTSIFQVQKNVKIASDLVEKFHKFRLQNYSGKTVSLLPKRTLVKNEDITQTDQLP